MSNPIEFNQLKKKGIIFGLEDVLVPGKIDESINMGEVKNILNELATLEKKFEEKGFHLFLITGLPEKVALDKIRENNLGEYFKVGHLFFVNESYINSKAEVDKVLYEQHLEKDPAFKDEYFKQVIIEKIATNFKLEKKDLILIGNDIWTEGYYTDRFSKIDFAIIESANASLGIKKNEKIPAITYIPRTWEAIQNILLNDFPTHDPAPLEKFVFKVMSEKLTEGTQIGGLTKLANKNQ
jgi:hypothetical protein